MSYLRPLYAAQCLQISNLLYLLSILGYKKRSRLYFINECCRFSLLYNTILNHYYDKNPTSSYIRQTGFDLSLKHLAGLATLVIQRNSLSVDDNIYAPLPRVEHWSSEFAGCYIRRNAIDFSRIDSLYLGYICKIFLHLR